MPAELLPELPGTRGPDGKFLNGHRPGGRPKGARNKVRYSAEFARLVREYLESPDTWKLIVEKVERDLKADGPATFAIRFMAYGLGEPRQLLEVQMNNEVKRLAGEAGVSEAQLLALAEQMSMAARGDSPDDPAADA